MIIEVLIAILAGILFGIFTGLCPGIHINLVSTIVVALYSGILGIFDPLILSVFIIAMAVTHTFLDNIPSIFLGAPNPDTVLSVLPGHRMLLDGKGHEAVMLVTIGSLFALIMAVVLSPLIGEFIIFIYPYLEVAIGFILLAVSIFLIFRENKSRFWAFAIFILAGVLGILTLNSSNLKNPLFPLLSGLFGISTLILSINEKSFLPKQNINKEINIDNKNLTKSMTGTLVSGTACSFLPGLGPAQAAIMGSQFLKNLSQEGFLVLVGGLNTLNMVLSFLGLYTIEKARNGAVVSISQIMNAISLNDIILFLGVSLLAGGIATFLTIFLSKKFINLMSKINYKKLVISIIFFIVILSFILSGVYGFLILIVSTAIGMLPSFKNIGKNHLMGCLIVPVMLYFLL